MSEIAPVGAGSPGRVDSFTQSPRVPGRTASQPQREEDQVEVSAMASYLNKLKNLPIRQELVDTVRDEISQGTYDTQEKLDAAITELSQDL